MGGGINMWENMWRQRVIKEHTAVGLLHLKNKEIMEEVVRGENRGHEHPHRLKQSKCCFTVEALVKYWKIPS